MNAGAALFEVVNLKTVWIRVPVYTGDLKSIDTSQPFPITLQPGWNAVYLELDPRNFYYITYSRGLLQAFSSEEDFNKAIADTKADKRKLKNEKGKSPYQFMLASKAKLNSFLKRFDTE